MYAFTECNISTTEICCRYCPFLIFDIATQYSFFFIGVIILLMKYRRHVVSQALLPSHWCNTWIVPLVRRTKQVWIYVAPKYPTHLNWCSVFGYSNNLVIHKDQGCTTVGVGVSFQAHFSVFSRWRSQKFDMVGHSINYIVKICFIMIGI